MHGIDNDFHEPQPTWDDDIKQILTAPPWLPEHKSKIVGQQWKAAMLKYGAPVPDGNTLALDNYKHVKLQAQIIYRHCASRSMPITKDHSEFWPRDILRTFLLWINQGSRKSSDDPTNARVPQLEEDRSCEHRVRKDICELTAEELRIYRTKLQDTLRVTI
ncbi:hypothetical protein Q7P35_002905 [Cladosporium inversicolor]